MPSSIGCQQKINTSQISNLRGVFLKRLFSMLVGGAFYFSAAEALCTHIYSLCSITNYRTDSLHIRGPISSGFYVGMADPVPNYSGLAAYFTFRHVAPTSLKLVTRLF